MLISKRRTRLQPPSLLGCCTCWSGCFPGSIVMKCIFDRYHSTKGHIKQHKISLQTLQSSTYLFLSNEVLTVYWVITVVQHNVPGSDTAIHETPSIRVIHSVWCFLRQVHFPHSEQLFSAALLHQKVYSRQWYGLLQCFAIANKIFFFFSIAGSLIQSVSHSLHNSPRCCGKEWIMKLFSLFFDTKCIQ